MGISLGSGCVMSFHPGTNKAKGLDTGKLSEVRHTNLRTELIKTPGGGFRVEVYLPRRSVYIMSGDSRTEWKHGVMHITAGRQAAFGSLPEWNQDLMYRRSITLRLQKFFSDEVLKR